MQEWGGDVDRRNVTGNTPLHIASQVCSVLFLAFRVSNLLDTVLLRLFRYCGRIILIPAGSCAVRGCVASGWSEPGCEEQPRTGAIL